MGLLIQSKVTPVITAGAYVAGDAVGGMLTLINAGNRGFANLLSAVLIDKAGQNAPMDLFLFDKVFTPTADNAPIAISVADLLNCVGVLSFDATDYASAGTGSVATLKDQHLGVIAEGTTDIYGQLVVRSAPVYASVGDLTLKVLTEDTNK